MNDPDLPQMKIQKSFSLDHLLFIAIFNAAR